MYVGDLENRLQIISSHKLILDKQISKKAPDNFTFEEFN
ncbi:hypothetical protein T4A_404 [Trichinella pseudospiralis]|uniref:Uncharacterized protein n=1 Tax=Trichinella pseudospiralis TaxID=6337 RepID=A0A0V1DKA8_TRIPS|nr:hypothetical protein T4A_404 [Trichinella pseudospiralis]